MMVRTLCAALAVLAGTASCQQTTLTILHTNDMHASFNPHEAAWIRSGERPLVGGFDELASAVDSLRALHPDLLLLDAGDVMTGNPICDISYEGAQGGMLFAMMNRIGYDAWCFGNHDLDISQDNLKALAGVARFPAVSANLVNDAGEHVLGNRDDVIIERGGLRIGIIGVISQELSSLVNQNNLTGVRVLSPVETVRRLVKDLDPQTDLLVALTHEGFSDDSLLAEEVPGLDVIVGGHSHTRLSRPKVVNNVIIVQAGSNCENLGVLQLTVADDRVTSHQGSLLQLWAQDARRRTSVSGLVDSASARIDREFNEVIAMLGADWRRGGGESNIGNFILEAQREAAGADVSFINTHGIRRDVPAGPLTRRELYEVLPFRNVVVTWQCTGRELRAIMQFYLTQKPPIEMSGMECRWRKKDGGAEIEELKVQGVAVADDKTYRCAASDYFVGEAERYLGHAIEHPLFLRRTLFEAAEDAARKAHIITATVEHRIKEIK